MNLRDLDRRYVPLAADAVSRLAQRIAVRREGARTKVRGVDVAALRDLDGRFARSGPLGLVREVPQIGFVAIAAVFLGGMVTAGSQEAAKTRAAQRQEAEQVPAAITPGEQVPLGLDALGPEVGDLTTDYEKVAALGLRDAVKSGADERRVALVSLTQYRTPLQAEQLLTGLTTRRVYLRAKAAGKEAAQLPVDIKQDLGQELVQAYAATAKGRLAAQRSYQGYVDSLVVTTKEEQAFKDLYVAFATSTGIEAREYQGACACVFAVVVEGPSAALLQLRERSGVRAVQVAGKGQLLKELQVHPLLPEVVGRVPKAQAGADGQL